MKSWGRKNVFNSIEKIKLLLRWEKKEKRKIKKLLDHVAHDIYRLEGRYVLFFEDAVTKKLRKLFPKHPFLKKHHSVVEFSNTIKLLVDGDDAFRKVLENIEKAKESIVIQMFIWKNDGIGVEIGKKLLEAAERGVKIEIFKDALGSVFEIGGPSGRGFFQSKLGFLWTMISKFLLLLYSEPGPRKTPDFNISDRLLSHENVTVHKDHLLKDHSKYFIFDDTILMIGGMNIGDEYYRNHRGRRARHDYMIEMESRTVVKKFRHRLKGSWIDDFDDGASVEFALNVEHHGKQFEIASKFEELLDKAQKKIIIEMAYLGDSAVTRAIIQAAQRGLRVQLIIPKSSNLQDNLNKWIAKTLFEKTDGAIEIYFYPKPLHAKVLLADDQYSFLGSANLNVGALRTLKETNVLVNDADCQFTTRLKKALQDDMKISSKVMHEEKITFNKFVAFCEMVIAKVF